MKFYSLSFAHLAKAEVVMLLKHYCMITMASDKRVVDVTYESDIFFVHIWKWGGIKYTRFIYYEYTNARLSLAPLRVYW
jgi:hypothetical protein